MTDALLLGASGVVAQHASQISLHHCLVRQGLGPAIDVSDSARLTLIHTTLDACEGGLWLWDQASATVVGGRILGGGSFALLRDHEAHVTVASTNELHSNSNSTPKTKAQFSSPVPTSGSTRVAWEDAVAIVGEDGVVVDRSRADPGPSRREKCGAAAIEVGDESVIWTPPAHRPYWPPDVEPFVYRPDPFGRA